jgi:hypothetical protein
MNGFNTRVSVSAARYAALRQRPLNNRIGLIGHSMLDQAIGQLVSGQQLRSASLALTAFPSWVSLLSRGRYLIPENCKFAVAASLVSDLSERTLTAATAPSGFGLGKTQLQAAIDCPAATIAVMSGHNDRMNGVSLATSITKMTLVLNALTGAGKIVLLCSAIPTGSASFPTRRLTGSQLAAHLAWCDWTTRIAPTLWPGQVYAIDFWQDMVDMAPSATAGDVVSAKTQDGVHPSSWGAYLMARRVLAVLDGLGIPAAAPNVHRRGEVYDATSNPRGNLLGANGLLADAGTALSGSSGGVTFSGVRPSGANVYVNSAGQAGTLTIAGAMVTTPTGAWWQMTVTGTTAANAGPNFTLNPPNLSPGNVAPNDVLHGFGEFEIDAGGTGLCGFPLALIRNLAGPQVDNMNLGYGGESTGVLDPVLSGLPGPLSGSWNGDLLSTVSGTETSISTYLQINLKASATVNLTMRVRNLAVRKVM